MKYMATVTGQVKMSPTSALSCPNCGETRGLVFTTEDTNPVVSVRCPSGHMWTETRIAHEAVVAWSGSGR